MKTTLIAAAALSALAALAEPNDWENTAVNSRNREPARAYSMPLASADAALTDALEPATPYRISLNGTWKISWCGNPALRPLDFWKTDFDDSDWFTIDVPSCVEMRGFGSPGYVNVRYPHANKWPRILNRDTEKPDYNPVSSYRRTFTVPAAWKGRDVFIRFDGVYSAYYVWVNGQQVGYAEDSKLPSEFNITKYLKDGENQLAVEVYRWCDGSYLEDQDMFRYSGIYRDVSLFATPKVRLDDFYVTQTFSPDYRNATLNLKTTVRGGDAKVSATLYDAAFRPVGTFTDKLDVPNVRLWSAEDPYLYTLVMKAGDDIRACRVGFKEVKIVGNAIVFNGKKIKFKGVNRHECSPENGRTVSMEEMLKDITLFKQFNINTVRTCHYPDHHSWYDLCDKYGIYVVAEANVEAHEPGYGKEGLGLHKEWFASIKERNLNHVTNYRNHPAVTLWSMGNETGHGPGFIDTIAAVKQLDPTRPIHWERGNIDADVDSTMYPSVEWLDGRGQLGDNIKSAIDLAEKKQKPDSPTRHSAGKAFFMCEYAHAMGNAIGNFQEYWDVFYKYDSLAGGCIWDWVDQAIWKYTDRVCPKTGKRERFLAYGADFDEEPNDGPFCCNGVVDPFRNVSAKLVEVGHVHRNLVVEKYDAATEAKDIIFYGYLWQEKKTFALDYNDLIKFTLYVFAVDDAVRDKWQSRLEYIMIDEFQDIDRPQYELMEALCAKHKNLFIVGDPDQTIYTWRGADVGYLLNFDRNFPDVKTVMMNENYRSTPQILAAANSLISKNKKRVKKDLVATCGDGPTVECHHAENTDAEAAYIASRVAGMRDDGVPLGDIAVLYRAHHVTRAVEEAFIRAEIPYAIYSGVPFFNRAEIKDALSYLRLVVYRDDLSFARVVNMPKRNIGERRMRFIRDYAERENVTLYEALRRNVDDEIMKNTKAKNTMLTSRSSPTTPVP